MHIWTKNSTGAGPCGKIVIGICYCIWHIIQIVLTTELKYPLMFLIYHKIVPSFNYIIVWFILPLYSSIRVLLTIPFVGLSVK